PGAALPVRADQLDVPVHLQPVPERVAVVPLGADQPPGLRVVRPLVGREHVHVVQRPLQQGHLRLLAESRWHASGTPSPSTTTIHLVPLPRLVFPTPAPPCMLLVADRARCLQRDQTRWEVEPPWASEAVKKR